MKRNTRFFSVLDIDRHQVGGLSVGKVRGGVELGCDNEGIREMCGRMAGRGW